MILLKELKLNNFLSHEETILKFNDSDKLLLEGRSGSGKSSIIEAILWCFYGKGRSDNRSLIRRGSKSASVSLKLNDGKLETVITRSVSSRGKNTLVVTQNTGTSGQFVPIMRTGIKDTQDWIEKDFLRASYELFTNSVAYPQENENSFVKANASRRKDLLLEIVRAGSFDELYEKTREAIKDNELETASSGSKIESLEITISKHKDLANKKDQYEKEVETLSVELAALSSTEKKLEKDLNDLTTLAQQIDDKKNSKELLSGAISTINETLARDEKEIEEHNKIDINAAQKDLVELEKILSDINRIEKELASNAQAQQNINAHLANKPHVANYEHEIETINKRLIPLIKDMGKCPSGDQCPFVVPIQGQIDFLSDQITEKVEKGKVEKEALERWEKDYANMVPAKDTVNLYAELKTLKEKAEKLSPAKDLVNKYQAFETTHETIKNRRIKLELELKDLLNKVKTVDNSIAELKERFVKIDSNTINTELSTVRVSLQKIQKTRDEASSNLALAINAKNTIKDASTELTGLRKTVSKHVKDRESLDLLKEAFSPRGIKAVVVDYLVPQLEERINKVLGQMSDFRIRLDTQKATADEEGVKEGLFITVLNDQREELSFSNYSGGEKIKITVAISEALSSLQNQIGFKIMDENIVSLDKESTEGFVHVLNRLQEQFPQLLIISHLQEVKDLFDKQVTIIKKEGISKII